MIAWFIVIVSVVIHAAEHNPYQYERYEDLTDSALKMNASAIGWFMDAMKSFMIYTALQHVPGTKESGVGYYYNNKDRSMKRILFYRLSQGYPRETKKPLDFYLEGKGFFVIELPGGWPAYTQDGRFDIDSDGRLVTYQDHFPVMGEGGHIYLNGPSIRVDKDGVIYQNGAIVDVFRTEFPVNSNDLQSFNHQVFYFSEEDWADKGKMVPANVGVLQGYVSDSSITKGYVGLVPEWKNGHQANVKMVKAYIKNLTLAVQAANPQ